MILTAPIGHRGGGGQKSAKHHVRRMRTGSGRFEYAARRLQYGANDAASCAELFGSSCVPACPRAICMQSKDPERYHGDRLPSGRDNPYTIPPGIRRKTIPLHIISYSPETALT
ncbi:hypothetical protein C2857_005577 [Epichloe festucae Fl1]|uniref:Uncharacterized protein n=1 Tax=Epichloe festucae (strain Fl1) TaxID=877507 RepID=A0A7S9KPR7_EPIFF|nr:hypothetical protein C2857_005577 [Epichloe festucae Fl1]